MAIEVLTPGSRAEWLALRGNTIGASESACLFGVHPFMTAYELHHLKAGTIAADPTETGPMRRGRHLEQVAIEFLREERPDWIVRANTIPRGSFYRDLATGLSCTPDALVRDPNRPGLGVCQIKSVEPSVYRSRWRDEDGGVEVPLYVAVQAVQEALLTGASWAVVCPLVIGFSIEMPVLEVPLHAGLIERLKKEAAAFWRCVRTGQAPEPDYARDSDVVARLFPADNGQELDLTGLNHLPDLLAERDRLKADIKAASEKVDAIDGELKARLGPHEAALVAGSRRVTWRSEHRRHRFVPQSETRVLRVSAAR